MSKKADKKIRQIFRRDMRATLDQLSNQHFKDGPVFNKKPKLCPLWFWNWCVTLVCDANFLMRYRIYIKNNPIENHDSQEA